MTDYKPPFRAALAAGFGERIVDRVFSRTQQGCADMASRLVGIEDV